MADNLLTISERSLAKAIDDNVTGDAYIEHPDFDFDKHPSRSSRTLPYHSVSLVTANDGFAFDGGTVVDPEYEFNVRTCASTDTQLKNLVGELKQSLGALTSAASGIGFWYESYPGLPLYDEATLRDVGVLNMEFGGTVFFDALEKSEFNNLKHSANTLVRLSPIVKQRTKDLL